FVDLVFDEWLLTREDHADEAGIQRLLEFPNELGGIGAGVEGRDQVLSGFVEEPDRAFVSSGVAEAALDGLAHERIEQGAELFGMNGRGHLLQAVRESGLELRKSGGGEKV